tara:strand:- start:1747 stop:1992 length:246 start_codon:yes stop_codon:yes gene_type:complete
MSKMGIKKGRFHPAYFFNDWNAWANTDEGKAELKEKQEKDRKLMEARKIRIKETARAALKDPQFLTTTQRNAYRKVLNEDA